MIRDYIRKDLSGFTPYHVVDQEYQVKLDANENPYPHDPKVIEAMKAWIDDSENMRRYPDTNCKSLRRSIASYWGVKQEEVICGVGSDQLIESTMKAFLEPGDKVLMPSPSFGMYKLSTTLNRGIPVEFSLNEDYSYPIDKIISTYKETHPKCVILCTPNNPTGNIITVEDMERLLEVITCPLIIDEAYGEFLGESMIKSILPRENVMVLRTFSKAYGSAGLRVGYGVGSKAMVDALSIVIPPYHLNAFSQYMAETILSDTGYYDQVIEKLNRSREGLYDALSTIGYITRVYPSKANYILIKVAREDIDLKLREQGILVRGLGTSGPLACCIRITVGTEEENVKLIEAMKGLCL